MKKYISTLVKRRPLPHTLALCCSLVFATPALARDVVVDTANKLQNALQNAQPGDVIKVKPGIYVGNGGGVDGFQEGEGFGDGSINAVFWSNRNGTSSNKIVLESYSTNNKAVLKGPNRDSSRVFYLQGDHWIVRNLKFTHAQKGILLDGANNNKFNNIEVYNTGQEAFHFRLSSSNNELTNCYIHDTGKGKKSDGSSAQGLGEGVYVGSDRGDRTNPQDNSNDNWIGGCKIGPQVTAEAFDVKEATFGTVIEYNWVDAKHIAGEGVVPGADSFIDLKGDEVIVRYNNMKYNGSTQLDHALHTLRSHMVSNVYNNTFSLPSSKYTYKLSRGVIHVKSNTGQKLNTSDDEHYSVNTKNSGIESGKPSRGPYACYSELTQCGGTVSATASSSSGTTYWSSSSSSGGTTSGSTSSSGGTGGSCLSYSGTGLKEMTLNSANCINVSGGLAGKEIAIADSDANPSCNIRGSVTGSGGGSRVIDGDWELITSGFSGSTLNFSVNNGCKYLKLRVR